MSLLWFVQVGLQTALGHGMLTRGQHLWVRGGRQGAERSEKFSSDRF